LRRIKSENGDLLKSTYAVGVEKPDMRTKRRFEECENSKVGTLSLAMLLEVYSHPPTEGKAIVQMNPTRTSTSYTYFYKKRCQQGRMHDCDAARRIYMLQRGTTHCQTQRRKAKESLDMGGLYSEK